jgi:hypothetical protein
MSNRPLLTGIVQIFSFRKIVSHKLNYFQTRVVKTALGKTALTEGYFMTTKVNFKDVYTILKWATYLFCLSEFVNSSKLTLLLKIFLSCVLYLEIFNLKFTL